MTNAAKTIAFEIKNRWTGNVQFTAQIECAEDTPLCIKLGLALKWGYVSSADLRGADLRGADLSSADLRDADLRGADLRDAVLRDADLRGADLSGADLSSADLRGADLRDAVLRDADLRDAVLRGAVLRGAVLRGADLRGADLRGAVLRDADLRGAKIDALTFARTSIVPESGDYTAWKQCMNGVLVKLLIPSAAKRSNATGRKCRAEFAQVVEVVGADVARSLHDQSTEYRVGETVRCHEWDCNRWNECSGGIHHYLSRIEAENH